MQPTSSRLQFLSLTLQAPPAGYPPPAASYATTGAAPVVGTTPAATAATQGRAGGGAGVAAAAAAAGALGGAGAAMLGAHILRKLDDRETAAAPIAAPAGGTYAQAPAYEQPMGFNQRPAYEQPLGYDQPPLYAEPPGYAEAPLDMGDKYGDGDGGGFEEPAMFGNGGADDDPGDW
jgi:hypothetical protein